MTIGAPRLTRRRTPPSREWIVAGVFALALGVRLAWVWAVESPFDTEFSDMAGYMSRARELLSGEPSPDERYGAFFPFGTHAVYAAELALSGKHRVAMEALHAIWGAFPAPLLTAFAFRLAFRPWAAALLGVVAALWQPHLVFTGYFSSEQLFATLILGQAWFAVRAASAPRRAALWASLGAGVMASLAYVVRPQFLLTAAMLLAALAVPVLQGRRSLRFAVTRVAVAVAPFALTLAFAALRYRAIAGHFGLISDNGAVMRVFADTSIARLEAVHKTAGGEEIGYYMSPPGKASLGEAEVYTFDGYIGDAAILESIRKDRVKALSPAQRVRRSLRNVALLFTDRGLWPEMDRATGWRWVLQRAFRRIGIALLAPLSALGLVLTLRRPKVPLVVAAANVLTAVVAAAAYFGEMRYRVPYDPFLLLLAAVAVAELVGLAHRPAPSHLGVPAEEKLFESESRFLAETFGRPGGRP